MDRLLELKSGVENYDEPVDLETGQPGPEEICKVRPWMERLDEDYRKLFQDMEAVRAVLSYLERTTRYLARVDVLNSNNKELVLMAMYTNGSVTILQKRLDVLNEEANRLFVRGSLPRCDVEIVHFAIRRFITLALEYHAVLLRLHRDQERSGPISSQAAADISETLTASKKHADHDKTVALEETDPLLQQEKMHGSATPRPYTGVLLDPTDTEHVTFLMLAQQLLPFLQAEIAYIDAKDAFALLDQIEYRYKRAREYIDYSSIPYEPPSQKCDCDFICTYVIIGAVIAGLGVLLLMACIS